MSKALNNNMTTTAESGASVGRSRSHTVNGPEDSDPPAIHEIWKLLGDANLLHRCQFEVVPMLRLAHNAVTEGKALVKGDKSFSAFTKTDDGVGRADRNTRTISPGELSQDDSLMLIFCTLLLNWKCGIVTTIVTSYHNLSLGDMLTRLLDRLPEDNRPPLVELNRSGRKCHTLSRDAQVNKVKKCCAIVASSTLEHFEAARDFLTQYQATRNRYKGWGLILDGGKERINTWMGKGARAEAARSAFKDNLIMPSGIGSAPFFTMDVTISSGAATETSRATAGMWTAGLDPDVEESQIPGWGDDVTTVTETTSQMDALSRGEWTETTPPVSTNEADRWRAMEHHRRFREDLCERGLIDDVAPDE